MNVENEAYTSNHDDAEPMFVNEEVKRPTIGGLMLCMCGEWLIVLYLDTYIYSDYYFYYIFIFIWTYLITKSIYKMKKVLLFIKTFFTLISFE